MKTQIIMIGIVFLLGLVGAVNLYSGESYSFESEKFDYWDVVGNSSSMEGMEIFWENGNTTISFSPLFKSDNFTIIFYNKEKEVIKEVHHGGGGTVYKYKDRNITKYKTIEVPKYINQTIEKPCPPTIERNYVKEYIMIGITALILAGFLIGLYYLKRVKIEKPKTK